MPSRFILMVILVLATLACNTADEAPVWPPPRPTASPPRPNVFPARAAAILRSSRSLQVFSLDPRAVPNDPSGFHGWPILGSIEIKAQRHLFIEQLVGAVATDSWVAACFLPRHGVRAGSATGGVDLVICFQCHQVEVIFASGDTDAYIPDSSIEPALNNLLKQAGIPVVPPF